MRSRALAAILAVLAACVPVTGLAVEADQFDEVLGYTVIASSAIDGEPEEQDSETVVRLENGMSFRIEDSGDSFAISSAVAVFARTLSIPELRRSGIKPMPTKPITLYKLLIQDGDEFHDADRLR